MMFYLPNLKRCELIIIIIGGLFFASYSKAQVPSAPKKEKDLSILRIRLVQFRNDYGVARLALFHSPDGYPRHQEKAYRTAVLPIKNKQCKVKINQLPFGHYAVSILHDENNNGKLDTNWIGVPKEGVGASNNATRKFGPPRFDDARFVLNTPTKSMTINVRY